MELSHVIVDSELTDLIADVFSTSVQLSWEAISTNNEIIYTYEVAFILSTKRECSSTNVNTLPDGYTSYRNTTETHIEIIELESNTCYIFGVRLYSTVPGDWNILVERTEGIKYKIIMHNKIVIIIFMFAFRLHMHAEI